MLGKISKRIDGLTVMEDDIRAVDSKIKEMSTNEEFCDFEQQMKDGDFRNSVVRFFFYFRLFNENNKFNLVSCNVLALSIRFLFLVFSLTYKRSTFLMNDLAD